MRRWREARNFVALIVLASGIGYMSAASAERTFAAPENASSNSMPSGDSCTAEEAVVQPGESISVYAWIQKIDSAMQFAWAATGGYIEGQGTKAVWDFTGVKPGYYKATVRWGNSACSVQVIVEEASGGRGTKRQTGQALLARNATDDGAYGLFSYVLLGAPPDDNSRDRYLKVMEAYLSFPAISSYDAWFDRRQLNVTYLPVDAAPKTTPTAQWLLDHYDYARAQFFMRSLQGSHLRGPYIVSSLKPLSKETSDPGPLLYQDLSTVPPHLISMWMEQFRSQAEQEHFWEEKTGKLMVLKLRTAIGILAVGLPEVRKSLDDWISWTR